MRVIKAPCAAFLILVLVVTMLPAPARAATATPTTPTTPTGFSLVAGEGSVIATWTASAGAGSYLIQYGEGDFALNHPVGSGTATSATISGLTNGTTYRFRLRACSGPDPNAHATCSPFTAAGIATPTEPSESMTFLIWAEPRTKRASACDGAGHVTGSSEMRCFYDAPNGGPPQRRDGGYRTGLANGTCPGSGFLYGRAGHGFGASRGRSLVFLK